MKDVTISTSAKALPVPEDNPAKSYFFYYPSLLHFHLPQKSVIAASIFTI